MTPITAARSLLPTVAAAALLAGCGGSQPPIGTPGAMLQSEPSAIATRADRGGSWMLPEAKTSDLLYVGGNNDYVSMYTYPKGRLVGVIDNPDFYLPSGECVDGSGDVFIPNLGNGKIFEYKHGSTKVWQTLQITGGGVDCAVDPTTGNLAVTSFGLGSSGYLRIFSKARGTPKLYSNRSIYYYYFCGYDGHGNLFVDGQGSDHETFAFAELRRGGKALQNITLNQSILWPGSLVWDGKYVAVGDQKVANVYEFSISGSSGTLVNTTPINGIRFDDAFWIQGKRILVTNGGGSYQSINYFQYPIGGEPTKIVRKDVAGPRGLTVSLAKKS
jgi:hypothetical protein